MGADNQIRHLQRSLPNSISLCTTPEAVWLPAAARTTASQLGEKPTYPRAVFVRHGGAGEQQLLYSHPSTGGQKALPCAAAGTVLSCSALLLPSAHGWEEAGASSLLLTAQPYLAKALRERERGKQGRRLLHVNHILKNSREQPFRLLHVTASSSQRRMMPLSHPAISHHHLWHPCHGCSQAWAGPDLLRRCSSGHSSHSVDATSTRLQRGALQPWLCFRKRSPS